MKYVLLTEHQVPGAADVVVEELKLVVSSVGMLLEL